MALNSGVVSVLPLFTAMNFHRLPRRLVLLVCAAGIAGACSAAAAPAKGAKPKSMLFYIGTYTGPKSKGIYASRLDMATGKLSAPQLMAETPSPSFLALHPNGHSLYAVNEIDNFRNQKLGSVTAFAIDAATGKLKELNKQSSGSDGPAHLTVDHLGKVVLTANYGGGSVESILINKDGSLGGVASSIFHHGSSANPERQKEPHAHSINMSPDNRFAFAADLGLDKILIYKLQPGTGNLVPNDPPFAKVAPGSGPRHFVFHPDGKHAYVINEILSTITAFNYDAKKGALSSFQTVSTLPKGFEGNNSTADLHVSPDGKFLYGSNRGHNSIAIFSIAAGTGRLTNVGHQSTMGKTPRNFAIDPTGSFLLAENQETNNIVSFRIDKATGKLTAVGSEIEVGAPVCIVFAK